VRDVGRLAVGLRALETEPHMGYDGAVAVFQTVAAPLTVITHAQFITPDAGELPAARSGPAEFVQSLVVDAEVVRDLVDHRYHDLVDDLVGGLADVQKGVAIDRDRVWQ
jgi:hypothetical protein